MSPAVEHRRGAYAGIVSRGVGYVIDAVVTAVIVSSGTFVVNAVIQSLGNESPDLSNAGGPALLLLITGLVFLFYVSICLWLFGKTLGMMVMGVRVVKADGTGIGLARALVRTFFMGLSSFFMLGYIWIAVDNRRQAWHDKIARTFIVYDWKAIEGSFDVRTTNEPLIPHG